MMLIKQTKIAHALRSIGPKTLYLEEFPGDLEIKDLTLSLLRLRLDHWPLGNSACHSAGKKKKKNCLLRANRSRTDTELRAT